MKLIKKIICCFKGGCVLDDTIYVSSIAGIEDKKNAVIKITCLRCENNFFGNKSLYKANRSALLYLLDLENKNKN